MESVFQAAADSTAVETAPEAEPVAVVADPAPVEEDAGDHQPNITPDMSYDAQQEEYARFARLEAERNDRIAKEAEEATRRAAEEAAENDRKAAEEERLRAEEEAKEAEEQAERDRLAAEEEAAAAAVGDDSAAALAMKPADKTVVVVQDVAAAKAAAEPDMAQVETKKLHETKAEKRTDAEAEALAGELLVVNVPDDVSQAATVRREKAAKLGKQVRADAVAGLALKSPDDATGKPAAALGKKPELPADMFGR